MSLSTRARRPRPDRARAAGADRSQVLAAVAARLPADAVADVPAGRASMADDVLHSANLGLDFVTGLTVAMAWFIVGNAMLMNVTERRRGLVAAAAARRDRHARCGRFVTAEAAILGGLGAIVGAGLGLRRPARSRPASPGPSRPVRPPSSVHPLRRAGGGPRWAWPLAAAAAWWPAREATAVDPLEGLAQAPAAGPRRPTAMRLWLVAAGGSWAVAASISRR